MHLPFFQHLLAVKVPAELHIYQAGGHGFGIGTPACIRAGWLDLSASWARRIQGQRA